MKTKPKPPRPATSNIRFRPEDWKLIDELRVKTGASTTTEVVRLALRAMAAKEGLR